jgi:hypothetical protein
LATPDDGRNVAAIIKLIGKDIPAMTLDGFEHPEFDEEGSRRRGRGGRRTTGRTVREPRKTRDVAVVEAVPEAAPEPAPARKPRREREARVSNAPAEPIRMGTAASNVTPFAAAARPTSRRRHEDDDDERVIGFGDHQPAFLLRPVRIGSRR